MEIVALSSGSALSETSTKVTFAAWAPQQRSNWFRADFGEIDYQFVRNTHLP